MYCLTSHSRIIYSYGDFIDAGEGKQSFYRTITSTMHINKYNKYILFSRLLRQAMNTEDKV